MKDQLPLVSVRVLAYNQEKTISQTLDCILQQDIDFPIEIIIGEDCSKDRTRDICLAYKEKYPDIIRLILHETNQGLLKNYKSTIDASRGKYLAGCAGDDYWHDPDKLKLQVEFLETHPDYGLVHSNINYLIMKTGEMRMSSRTSAPTGNVYRTLLLDGNHIIAPTVMFRRDLLRYVDIDDFIRNGFLMEDYPMWLELSNHTKFYFINKSLVTYRRNITSASYFSDYSQRVAFVQNIFQVKKYFQSKYPNGITTDELEPDYHKIRLALAVKYDHYNEVKYFLKYIDISLLKQRIKKMMLSNKLLYRIYKCYFYTESELSI
jgi:glycosyltransferase involved in cell wall biosynthesis